MFTILNAVLTFSFLISIVNSTPRPSAQDLDPNFNDAQNTNLFLDEMSNNDDLTISTPLTSMDTNLFGNQENLFAADTSTGNSCRAEDSQSLPLFGRLRRRQISSSGSGGDHLCTTNEASGPTLNPSLLDLPIAEDINVPDEQRRPEICPPWKFGTYRTLALCSAALPFDGISSEGQKILIVSNAMIWNPYYGCVPLERLWCCRSLAKAAPGSLHAEKPWGLTGYDCLENTGEGILIPKS